MGSCIERWRLPTEAWLQDAGNHHHTSMGVVHGMTADDVMKQGQEIDQVRDELGKHPHPQGQVEIKTDGNLDIL
jgi:hypothetical protein